MENFEEIDKSYFESLLKRLDNDNFRQLRNDLDANYIFNEQTNKYILSTDADMSKIRFIMKVLDKNKEFDSLKDIADYMKRLLDYKNKIIIFAYNKTGKTRLSYEFKSSMQEKNENNETISADTLYYNAFTEDLFFWDNDIEDDTNRVLRFNKKSKFFVAIMELSIDTRIRKILHNFADFDFNILYNEQNGTDNVTLNDSYGYIVFHKVINGEKVENIKISRGEESLFILCFFFAIVEIILMENNEAFQTYQWVKYIYIDDPVSSLDDENIIKLAVYIANLFKINNDESVAGNRRIIRTMPVVISTHHTLFYNVMYNEWYKKGKCESYFLTTKELEVFDENHSNKIDEKTIYTIKNINDTPFFYHVAMLESLIEATNTDKLYTYHFAILRSILEKTASFFGYTDFQECLKINKERQQDNILNDEVYYKRAIQILNHGGHSLFEPVEMAVETKEIFSATLTLFLDNFKFNIEKG